MADVTVVEIEEMEALYDGLARRARASLGVTSWGMQVMTLPPNFATYTHAHDDSSPQPGEEEVYIPLEGSMELAVGAERFELRPGSMARVGPDEERHLTAGEEGARFVAIGGVPGRAYSPMAWTEIGGPLPAVG